VKGKILKGSLFEKWFLVLGYITKFHLLMHGWICFVLRGDEDVTNVIGKDWLCVGYGV